jgi:CubicO group peptidase (beta-lactamase class C family)
VGLAHSQRTMNAFVFVLMIASTGLVLAEDSAHAKETIGSIRQVYDGALTPDVAVSTFRNIDRLFPTRVVRRGNDIYPLGKAARPLTKLRFTSRKKEWDLVDYLAVNRVAGLLVLKNEAIALESYQFGNTEKTRWMSMSVAKSITSTLIGAAVSQGYIANISEPVTKYVPQLADSAYEGVSIRDILMMSSGVKWNETYTDPTSDRRRLLDAQISQRPGAMLGLMSSLPRAAPPGTVNNYSTGETQIAGEVLRSATGKTLAQYLSERIWAKFGMEADATWWLESPNGSEIAGSGLSARLRDYGRFGLFIINGGVIHGESILPIGWTEEAGSPKVLKGGKAIDYGYFWWPAWTTDATSNPQGAYMAIGIFGQYIYVNPKEHVVIVVWSAQSKPVGMDIIDDEDFFAGVVTALHEK